jgi:hypothetical protein
LNLETILDKGLPYLRARILEDFRVDSCIATTRATIRLLRHYGYDAAPCPVRLFAFNKQYLDQLEKGTRPPTDPGALSAWCDLHKAWSVGLGVPVPGKQDGYEGHLVVLMNEPRRLLIDGSADQVSRPKHGILVNSPIVSPCPEGFPIKKKSSIELLGDHGELLIYEPIDNQRWRVSPDWNNKKRTQRALRKTIDYLDE